MSATLSPACMKVLDDQEIVATVMVAGLVTLHDVDGGHLFVVTPKIDVIDLRTLLRMHAVRFTAGRSVGRDDAFAQLRALIGAESAS